MGQSANSLCHVRTFVEKLIDRLNIDISVIYDKRKAGTYSYEQPLERSAELQETKQPIDVMIFHTRINPPQIFKFAESEMFLVLLRKQQWSKYVLQETDESKTIQLLTSQYKLTLNIHPWNVSTLTSRIARKSGL